MQAIPMQAISMQAILVQASKDTIAIYLFRELYPSQVFILQVFTLLFRSEERRVGKECRL